MSTSVEATGLWLADFHGRRRSTGTAAGICFPFSLRLWAESFIDAFE
jgi:hypothetical protein